MVQEVIMTKQEQVDMYMKCSKKELCEMLIEANKHLKKQLTLTDVVQAKPEKVCKGSWQLGNNCKKCKRCLDTKQS